MGILSTFLPRNRSIERGGLRQAVLVESPDDAFARIERERLYAALIRQNKPAGTIDDDHPCGDLSADEYAIIVGVGQTLSGYEQDRTAPERYRVNVAKLKAGRKSLDEQVAKLNGNAPDSGLCHERSEFNNLTRKVNAIVQRHRRAFDDDEQQILPLYPGIGGQKKKWWQ
jgi:hypothetical protein